jgi:hypothetical protein
MLQLQPADHLASQQRRIYRNHVVLAHDMAHGSTMWTGEMALLFILAMVNDRVHENEVTS